MNMCSPSDFCTELNFGGYEFCTIFGGYTVCLVAQKCCVYCVLGLATAAGCQLVASCDLVIAGENAKFATPG